MAYQAIDVTVIDHGSLVLVTGHTNAGKNHLAEHMPDDAMMWGNGYVVEHRFIDHIVQDLISQDLTVGAS